MIPPTLGGASILAVLNLGDNQLTGTIPPEVGNLVNLEFLSLRQNQLEGLVPFPVANLGGQIQSVALNRCGFESNSGLFMPDSPDYMDADVDGDGFICGVALSPPP
jgi:Leucine-rich repeat (LRR) protein